MDIKEIEESDYPEVIGLIKVEFPYVDFDLGKIEQRVKSGRIFLFKAVEKAKLMGFVEVELLEEGIARVNGLTVKKEFRKNGVAKALVEFAIEFLKKKKIGRILLLVKEENKAAKKVYEEQGFKFIGMYKRELDDAIVEEMELDISEGSNEDLSYVG